LATGVLLLPELHEWLFAGYASIVDEGAHRGAKLDANPLISKEPRAWCGSGGRRQEVSSATFRS